MPATGGMPGAGRSDEGGDDRRIIDRVEAAEMADMARSGGVSRSYWAEMRPSGRPASSEAMKKAASPWVKKGA